MCLGFAGTALSARDIREARRYIGICVEGGQNFRAYVTVRIRKQNSPSQQARMPMFVCYSRDLMEAVQMRERSLLYLTDGGAHQRNRNMKDGEVTWRFADFQTASCDSKVKCLSMIPRKMYFWSWMIWPIIHDQIG